MLLFAALTGCDGGGSSEPATIDADANEISAATDALVNGQVAAAEARGNEAVALPSR